MFCTHDAIRHVLSNLDNDYYIPNIGCIEIEDNVFIGTGSIIMPNVLIGNNTIIAAGSVVTKDIPPGCIAAGVPARIIGCFSDLHKDRKKETELFKNYNYEELVESRWQKFYELRNEKK